MKWEMPSFAPTSEKFTHIFNIFNTQIQLISLLKGPIVDDKSYPIQLNNLTKELFSFSTKPQIVLFPLTSFP